jgi:ribosomal-protein-alanine N-acetyltransferase
MNPHLGNGIQITEVRRSDKESVVTLLDDREIYRCTLRIPNPYTGDDFEKWFTHISESTQENGQPTCWAIRDANGLAIGAIGLTFPGDGQRHRAEIGYWLSRSFWNRGIITASVKAVCQHAFESLGLVKITAQVFSFNDASSQVLEKCGFRLEGYLRKHTVKDGQYLDEKAFALVR